jgi:hypothetical protein
MPAVRANKTPLLAASNNLLRYSISVFLPAKKMLSGGTGAFERFSSRSLVDPSPDFIAI